MSSTFEYTCVTPEKACSGADCYCFSGKNQFNTDISTISSVSSPVYAPKDGLFDLLSHPICDTNCDKPTKSLDQYITVKGCMFCDEECKENFTGIFQDEMDEACREDSFSYESDNDKTLMECELCLSLRQDEEVFFCGNCQINSCEKCRNKMISEGGLDCFDGEQDEYLCPACYKKSRQHLFFNENGAEISRDAFLKMQENEDWAFLAPSITRGTFRHPRVLLNFLRYIDSHNEVAAPDELIFLKPIPKHVLENMLKHSSIQNPSIGFAPDVTELLERIENHCDLS